ncbi:MAG: DUF6531 domain-containing protein, partial [Anaerosomatales bacterium]|nr:DUF6531 domain-containing protein [Anaerosomatales bacterium]
MLSPTTGTHVGYRSAQYTYSTAGRPYWEVSYAPVPTVSLDEPASGDVTDVPEAAWTFEEERGNPQAAWEVEVATSTAGPPLAAASGTGSAASAPVPEPPGGFAPLQTYLVRVRAASAPSAQTPLLWSEWSAYGSFRPTLPAGPAAPSATTTASVGWFDESDTDGDGVNDARNDGEGAGRGSVGLYWEPVAGASSYAVCLSDGYAYRTVCETTATAWTSAGVGLFPSDSQIAALPPNTTQDPFRAGDGLDLRDDPRPLYAATAGSGLDGRCVYSFKVVPRNAYGAVEPADCPAVEVALESRTVGVNVERAHATHALGDLAGTSAEVGLDTASLRLTATDLSIASWGPEAAVWRTYSSAQSAEGAYAPGWRFNFEQALEFPSGRVVHTDETGERRTFYPDGAGGWRGPDGHFSTLVFHDVFLLPDYWTLTLKDKTVLTFAEDGRLKSVADRNGNEVAYNWSGGDLEIRAANGQKIDVDYEGGKVVSATHATSEGARRVDYSQGAGSATVKRFASTECEYDTVYGYTSGRVTGVSAPSVSSSWVVAYGTTGEVLYVENTSGTPTPAMRRDFTIDLASRAATVTTFDGSTRYAWSPTGRTSLASTEGSATLLNTYSHDSKGLPTREVSATGRVTSRVYDARGNAVVEFDEGARKTSYVYNASDDCTSETDAKGSVTTRGFDARGNVLWEEKTLDSSGTKSRTEYTYDDAGSHKGRLTSQRSKIDATNWAETVYTDFCGVTGQAKTVTEKGVRLTSGAAAQDLVRHTEIDGFGNITRETDAEGVIVLRATFDIAGRELASTDASGVVSNTRYDRLGNTTESWRSHEGTTAKLDWRTRAYNGAGLVVCEVSKDSAGATISTVSYTYDGLGRQKTEDASDVPGVAESAYDSRGNETIYREEGAGTSAAATTRTVYDAESQETTITSPGSVDTPTEVSYTSDGQVEAIDEADGSSTDYEYNDEGELESETEPTDAGPAETTYTYDLAGRLVSSAAPNGTATTYTYDLLGRHLSSKAGGQPVTTTEYNASGWVLRETDFDGIAKTYTYDKAGRVISVSRGGLVTSTTYDGCGR